MSAVPTEELIARARQGDEDSLDALFERFQVVARQLAERQLAEAGAAGVSPSDIVQQAWEKARHSIALLEASTEDQWIAWISTLVRPAVVQPASDAPLPPADLLDARASVPADQDTAIHQLGQTDRHLAPTEIFRMGSEADAVCPAPEARAGGSMPIVLGNYELLEVIGRGGMGVVYKARQTTLNRIVAVKMIREANLASDRDVQRFYAEARAAGKLVHPNIVTIHQVGQVGGHHFFSMDYVEGTDLAQMAREARLPAERVARYVQTVAEAVHFAHENGILHRDLKPANVLIDGRDCPRVTDFGLAKPLEKDLGLTASGTTVGTPSYISPEQASGKRGLDQRSDVYSLGAILYDLLTGRPPFRAGSAVATVLEVLHNEPTAPRKLDTGVDRDLEAVCLKCLQKDPAKRYDTAQELAEELRRYLGGQPIRAKPIGAWTRVWYWARDIPLVAALVGRRSLTPTAWQRRTQWSALAIPIVVAAWLVARSLLPTPLPRQIRIATASRGGMYHAISAALQPALSDHLQRPVQLRPTQGSVENRDLLLGRKVEMAVIQVASVSSDRIAAVAPLYYEPVHLLVRRQATDVKSILDLPGKGVSLGPVGSGMRLTSLKLLAYFDVLVDSLSHTESRFTDLRHDDRLDAAIVTTGLQNPELIALLESGQFRLLDVDDGQVALKRPSFKPFVLRPEDYPAVSVIPSAGIATVASTAVLAVHASASDSLVFKTLETLYASRAIEHVRGGIGLVDAASWTTLPWHQAARRFYAARVQGHAG